MLVKLKTIAKSSPIKKLEISQKPLHQMLQSYHVLQMVGKGKHLVLLCL